MKKTNLILAAAVFVSTQVSFAEPYTANQGLDKIKSNFDNSKVNKAEYEKNLSTVNNNLNEISKAKTAVINQKNQVSKEILGNNDSLKKVLIQERDIQNAIKDEQNKVAAEDKQISELQKAIDTIKANQAKRQANVAQYEEQLKITQDEKASWKGREAELRAQEGEVIKSLKSIAADEGSWTNKKKGYEIEVKRWTAESEKQQKIYDTYQGLKQPSE